MMYILMLKRLESSWFSCLSTVDKLLAHRQARAGKVNRYLEQKQAASGANGERRRRFRRGRGYFPDEDDADAEDFTLGKRRRTALAEIEAGGKIERVPARFEARHRQRLDSLHSDLRRFRETIDEELRAAHHHHSKDSKLDALMAQIIEKRHQRAQSARSKSPDFHRVYGYRLLSVQIS